MSIKKDSFADGIKAFNTRGAFVIPTRLTKNRGRILWESVNEFRRNWYMDHPDSVGEDEMQFAMQWLVNQINKRWSQAELYRNEK